MPRGVAGRLRFVIMVTPPLIMQCKAYINPESFPPIICPLLLFCAVLAYVDE